MKITYDRETDSMTIVFRDVRIRESDEVTPNVIADYDEQGEIVGFEVLRASRVIADTDNIVYEQSA